MTELTTADRFWGDKGAPSPDELVRRAEAMREDLRAAQDEAEERGYYSREMHEAFLAAGFYHMLTPRRFGGLEVDLPTFLKVIVEIGRGDPSTGWCLALGHGHNLTTASHWPARAQEDLFRTDEGYFRASHSVAGIGTARRTADGYVIDARSPYQSGAPYSTHATVNVFLEDSGEEVPPMLAAIVSRDQFEMLDDWGGDASLGERASGSNTVVVSGAVVPEERVIAFDWLEHDYVEPSEGNLLHGNPMYLGPAASYFHMELVANMVGAAKAAVDEYERIITTRTTLFPPIISRAEDPDHLGDFGMGITMADASEVLLLRAGQIYMEYCAATVERGVPFTMEMDSRLYGMVQRAGEMASEAVALLYRSAGSSAGMKGQRMQRYLRDVSMYRGHISAQYRWTARKIAEIHFGRRMNPF